MFTVINDKHFSNLLFHWILILLQVENSLMDAFASFPNDLDFLILLWARLLRLLILLMVAMIGVQTNCCINCIGGSGFEWGFWFLQFLKWALVFVFCLTICAGLLLLFNWADSSDNLLVFDCLFVEIVNLRFASIPLVVLNQENCYCYLLVCASIRLLIEIVLV